MRVLRGCKACKSALTLREGGESVGGPSEVKIAESTRLMQGHNRRALGKCESERAEKHVRELEDMLEG
jgi:hypothetical protein